MIPSLFIIGVVLLIAAFTLGFIVVFVSRKTITRKEQPELGKPHPSDIAVTSIRANVERAKSESHSFEVRTQRLSELLDVRRGGRE